MIWYLLYPFRGTTEPPILPRSHPLRRAFTQYGHEASRHPVITLLISVALATTLIYPFPYLYTNNFTNGSSNLPHHAWTAAQPVEGDEGTSVDVIMRSVWIHGNYMKALEPSVLQAGLAIQDILLGPTANFDPKHPSTNAELNEFAEYLSPNMRDSYHASNGLSNQSWFFHSPLLYWSCSSQAILRDEDVITTINEGSRLATFVNVTLRHSIVFSGKRYEDQRLVAADALVITLVHKLDSPVGRQWESKAATLVNNAPGRWRMYPRNGRGLSSQLYEFKFQPLSFHDDLFLGIAYALTTTYFILSLTKLRAMKSRLGLTLAVITQIAFSIMSSFTICAILNVDLSKIPREAYPLVVLAIGLENIFRFINAVIVTPSENPTSSRITEALGQTGHIALAGVGQNLFILWLLCRIVSPGVVAFCTFAAIALTFDFLYLLTFFVAVLSVDVQRTELSDSLNRAAFEPPSKVPKEKNERRTWTDTLLRGTAPVSTRVAGTIVMISFILIAQLHFFDNEHPMRALNRFQRLFSTERKVLESPAARLSASVNQARSPMAWLQLQDHETAREVIQVIKPNAHSYIARVYDPLIFVLEGSDRNPSPNGVRRFLPALYDFLNHQYVPFFVTVLFTVAAVSLLMNYLLWNEETLGDDDIDGSHTKDEPPLTVNTLLNGHALDIAMLAASSQGIVVSVGLDRWIRVWDVRQDFSKSHMIPSQNGDINTFPVLAITVDASAEWVGLLSASSHVVLWNIPNRRWGPSLHFELNCRSPIAFFFSDNPPDLSPTLILVRSDGLLSEIKFESDELCQTEGTQLCKSQLLFAKDFTERGPLLNPRGHLCLLTTSQRGSVYMASQLSRGWTFRGFNDPCLHQHKRIRSTVPLPTLRSFLAVGDSYVDLVDAETFTILNTFTDIAALPDTVRCFHLARRMAQQDVTGLESFTIAYTCRMTSVLVIRTYIPKQANDLIHIGTGQHPPEMACCSWKETEEHFKRVESPGVWEALPIGVIVGVRRRSAGALACHLQTHSTLGTSNMRRRNGRRTSLHSSNPMERDDIWEAWMFSSKGQYLTVPLCSDDSERSAREMQNQLLVSRCGPMTKVGSRSIAVGFGNTVKIITVGHERFGEDSENSGLAIAGRRRKAHGSLRRKF